MTAQGDVPFLSRRLWQGLCLLVTVISLSYVLAQISWKDTLILGETRVTGWMIHRADGGRAFLVPGQSEPIPFEEEAGTLYLPGCWTLFRDVHPGMLGLGLIASAVSIVLMAVRWRVMLRVEQLDPGLGEVIRLTWLGTFASNFLPGSAGTDMAKLVCICRRSPGKKMAAAMTVLLSRTIGLASLLLVGALALSTQLHRPHLVSSSWMVCCMLLLIGVGSLTVFSRRCQRWLRIEALLSRLPLAGRLEQLRTCLLHYRHRPGALLLCLVISLVIQLWTIGCVYLLGLALGLKVAAIHYFVFLPVIFVAAAATPAIGGLGVREGAFQLFFSTVGASSAEALSLCILHRIAGLLVSMPGAWTLYLEANNRPVVASIEDQREERAAA